MRKISLFLFFNLSLFAFTLVCKGNEPFSDYSIIMDAREFDTEVFDWYACGDEDEDYTEEEYGEEDHPGEEQWDETDEENDFPASWRKPKSVEPIVNLAKAQETNSEQVSTQSQAHLDIEPSSIVNRSVDVIRGYYMDSEVDFALPGGESFVLQRNYISVETDKRGPLGKGWNRNYFGIVERTRHLDKHRPFQATVLEAGGAMYSYGAKRRHSFTMLHNSYKDAVTNCGSGYMSGRTNIRNNLLDYQEKEGKCVLNKSTGERLSFTQHKHRYEWRLTQELKTNGNLLKYDYLKDGKLGTLCCTNSQGKLLGEMTFEYGSGNGNEFIFINSKEKQKVSYRLQRMKGNNSKKAPYIVEVIRRHGPKITYSYEDKHNKAHIPRIIRKNKPDGRFQEIEYYKHGSNWVGDTRVKLKLNDMRYNRVKLQKAPVGHDGTPIITHRYFYDNPRPKFNKEGGARVYDAYNRRTDYNWNNRQRLNSITHYTGKTDHKVFSKEHFVWAFSYDQQSTFLLAQCTKDRNDKIHFMRTFKYDPAGNVLKDELIGNLTGDNSAPCEWGDQRGKAKDNGCERYSKFFTYSEDDRYLMTTMMEDQVTQSFSYKEGTHLLTAKLFRKGERLFKREFYTYDENAFLIKEIEDDGDSEDPDNLHGVKERHIRYIKPRTEAPLGLADTIEEKYVDAKTGEEHLLKRMVLSYNENGYLIKKDLFDASNAYLCTFKWQYDAHGNVTKEINPLKQTTIKRYDANDNKIYEQGPNPTVHKEFTYDHSNRLVRVDEIHAGGLSLSESYVYNYLSQKVAVIDIYGNETGYKYDTFGHETKVLLPKVVNESGNAFEINSDNRTYTLYNTVGVSTDFKGYSTTNEYTIRGMPTRTVYPDGSVEEMRYNPNGTLCKHTHKNGSYTSYKYDHLKRITFKGTYSPDGELLESLRYGYDTFHLLWEKDTLGHLKKYNYDAAGRLNELIDGEKRMCYEYDTIGRLWKTIEDDGRGNTVSSLQLFDLLDRVIEEKRVDAEGNLLTRVTYGYDVDGNRTTVTTYTNQGESTSVTLYDNRRQPIQLTDALGNTTFIHYKYDFENINKQIVPYSISVDPMGNSTENIKDAQGRLVKLIQRNAFGKLIHQKKFYYDKNGNKCRQIDTSGSSEGGKKLSSETRWLYDCMNHLTDTIEAVREPEQRHTRFVYNAFGERSRIIKPDGVKIHYTYDFLGRLKSQHSSDESIHYLYGYDQNGNLDSIEDQIHGLQSTCIYDSFDRMKSETFSHGLTVKYRYDKANRPKVITFPDGSGVRYIYKAHRLTEVQRLSKENLCVYTHRYHSYDSDDKVLEARLVGNAGNMAFNYDSAGGTTAVLYDLWEEAISSYDKVGNILMRRLTDPLGNLRYDYKYDDLYQIKEEKEVAKEGEQSKEDVRLTYRHNSFHNRISKGKQHSQYNKLNQLLSDGQYSYHYDLNGNLLSKKAFKDVGAPAISDEDSSNVNSKSLKEEQLLHYDALDRLIAVSTGNSKITYLYDAHNRRMTKRFEERNSPKSRWIVKNEINYIYIGQNEVGSYDQKGVAIDLRLLGVSKGAEIGAAIAVEILGEVYAPLHDHQGNVTALVNADDGKIEEFYRYTAFGEEQFFDGEGNQIETAINPWRFSSKRVDSETGFVYFGRRYYDPALGRWITPDPIGREGGLNIYAFVLNRTLTHRDSYGLFGLCGEGWGGYDPINAAFQWTKTFLNDFSRLICMGVNFAGTMINAVGYHLIPVPVVRDVFQIGGRVLSGQGFDDYHFAFCGKNVWGDLEGRWNYNPLHVICIVGGILTPASDMKQMALEVSNSLGGCNVHHFTTSSDGVILDFAKAGIRRIGISLPGDEEFSNGIKSLHESVGGSQAGGVISIEAHSQGALMMHNASKSLHSINQSIDAHTFGGAKMLKDHDYRNAKNYVSERDFIPFISNPLTYVTTQFNPRSDIQYLKSRTMPFIDHGWSGKTYQGVISKVNEKIKKEWGY